MKDVSRTEKMIIVIAPSGAGKSTFLDKILRENSCLQENITYTSRPMRSSEVEGVSYHFVSPQRFEELIEQDYFIEWAKVHGNYYGSPLRQVHEIWARGGHVIMDVDVQGAETFCQRFPQALTIFILPPSLEELRRRIMKRDGESARDLELRLSNAEQEISRAGEFDHQLINDDFERSYGEFKKIIDEYLQSQ